MYELFVAHKLGVKVRLCPHIDDADVVAGELEYDVCLQNIGTSVDSENAVCSYGPDKIAIHKAIKSLFSNGFVEINQIVEMIRLAYLLQYEVEKITGFRSLYNESDERNSEAKKEERRREAVEKHLVPSIITMLTRVHSIPADEIPSFEQVESQSESTEPIEIYLEWKKLVECLIPDKED